MNTRFTPEELMEGCRAGNRKMQEALYRQTAPKMLALCMRYANNRMEAEDVLQVGYIKIFQKINDYRHEGSLEGWMRRIMVNTAIENFRKSTRMLQLVAIENIAEIPVAADFDYSRLDVQDLMKLIQRLADGYKMVFNLYAIEGYAHKEIAELLGISEGASKSQLSRARAILRAEILNMNKINYNSYAG